VPGIRIIEDCGGWLRGARKGITLMVLAALVAMLAPAAPAMAGLQKEFSVFDDCPVSVPNLEGCFYSATSSGEFHLGAKSVPINKTIILQGGSLAGSQELVPAADGDTLSPTALQLPGGLIGVEFLPPLTEVSAIAELAGPVLKDAGNLTDGTGTALALPLKVKLENPFLGASCYIGSDSSPINLQLTSGTTSPPGPNKAITGNPGKLEFFGNGNIPSIVGASVVDNSFSVPGANGCGGLLALLVDPSVDLIAGVPAASGHNSAILNTTVETVSASLVVAQRQLPEFGRCVKVPAVTDGKAKIYEGSYSDSGCTSPEAGGRYEWSAVPGASPSFTATAGKTTLESVGGAGTLSCKHSTIAGSYTGVKSAAAAVTFSGCDFAANGAECQSSGAAPGEIVSSPLEGSLGFVKDAVEKEQLIAITGLDLHAPTILTATCGTANVSVSGSVIAPFATSDKTLAANTLTFNQAAGIQAPEAFEEEAKDTLTSTLNGTPSQSALKAKFKLKSAETVEIRAEAN
jgi:hypothetical protein